MRICTFDRLFGFAIYTAHSTSSYDMCKHFYVPIDRRCNHSIDDNFIDLFTVVVTTGHIVKQNTFEFV